MINSLEKADLEGKHVLVRVDFNVPFDSEKKITDDKRIKETLPTIDMIIDKGGIPVLMSHLGRPKGKVNLEYSLKPIAEYLDNIFGYNVHFIDDCIAENAAEIIKNIDLGDIVLLENLRFYPEEEANDMEFAKKLARTCDVYVNDAFGSAHRAHASTAAVASLFEEKYAGLLMFKELDYLGGALKNPRKPFTAIIGGAKISGKIDVISHLLDRCDNIIIGGGMMFTFYKAMGLNIGKSLLEEDKVELALQLIESAKSKNVNLVLPTDVLVADAFNNDAETQNVAKENIPDGWIGVDIGTETQAKYKDIILNSQTVVWNGPMGVFEMNNFAKGTFTVAQAMADATTKGAVTIVGGGDSAAAIAQMKFENKVSHVSTGGGASLEFLEGKELPGVTALEV